MEKSKIKTVVFSVSFWGENTPERFIPWYKCLNKHLKYDDLYLTCGSYSNPDKLPIPLEVAQIGIKNTKQYSKNWSYYYVGFLSGMYHALLSKDFDVLIHVQNRTFLGMNLNPIVEEFYNRSELIAAPKLTSQIGSMIDTGLMLMKKETAQKYVTSNLRPALSDEEQMNVEEEAYYIFGDSWWNFMPEYPSTRKYDKTYEYDESPFYLSDELFYDLPIIAGPKHCSEEEFDKWMKIKNEDIIDR